MSKVPSKLQVTVPKALADRFHIKPGDDIAWDAAGDAIRVVPAKRKRRDAKPENRLKIFDAATKRQRSRDAAQSPAPAVERGWSREELYNRGGAR